MKILLALSTVLGLAVLSACSADTNDPAPSVDDPLAPASVSGGGCVPGSSPSGTTCALDGGKG